MRSLNSPEIYRNMGFWNEATQQAILDTKIGIAGNGGTGNALGMELARIGVQDFSIADPEVFDDVNSNRVMGARVDTIGRNKAEVLAEDILSINPDAKIRVYRDGIDSDNVDEFIHDRDAVLNGLELKNPELAVMLWRAAISRKIGSRSVGVPVIDVEYIAHAGQGTVFNPNGPLSYEKFLGIKDGDRMPLADIAALYGEGGAQISPSRYLAYLPAYGDLDTLKALQEGSPLPSNMIGAGVASQIGAAEVVKLARVRVGEKGLRPTYAPNVRWYDAYTNKSGETRHPVFSHYRHLGAVVISNLLHRHEEASYTKEERANRGDLDK